jgi:hypothetical protein
VLADRGEALEAEDADEVEAVEMMTMVVDLSMLAPLYSKETVRNRVLVSLKEHEVREAEETDVALAAAPMDPRIGVDS